MSHSGHAAVKINLALHVIGQRPDGYHDLDSLVVFGQSGDFVDIKASEHDSFALTGAFAKSLPGNDDNLVLMARDLFRQSFAELDLPRLDITLEKNLPVAAGIGGGSADAAATLLRMGELANVRDDPRILQIAKKLGADVPMCLMPYPQRVRGTGDLSEPVGRFPRCFAVLVNPLRPVSTPEVFAGLKKRENPPLPDGDMGWDTLAELADYLGTTRNDLREPALALVPEIATIETMLATTDACYFARMSGSGATVFGLFESLDDAERAARSMRKNRPADWVATIRITGSNQLPQ